jgi:hypothetical protein
MTATVRDRTARPLVVACGALARELRAVLEGAGLADELDVQYLPSHLHNRPEQIAPAIEALLRAAGDRRCVVAYADCGTGGALDRVLRQFPGVVRLPGAHCYEVFAGSDLFAALHDSEPGTFYLTDYLALHFDALVWDGLGLGRHPELRDQYFAHYTRVALLAQSDDTAVDIAARRAAERLGLAYERVFVGRGELAAIIAGAV